MDSRGFGARRGRARAYQGSRVSSVSVRVRTGRSLRLRSSFIAWVVSLLSCHIAIGIGDAEGGKRLDLKTFHDLRLRLDLVVVAEEMQNSMNDQMGKMMRELLGFLLGFAHQRFIR